VIDSWIALALTAVVSFLLGGWVSRRRRRVWYQSGRLIVNGVELGIKSVSYSELKSEHVGRFVGPRLPRVLGTYTPHKGGR
jgi:hypothetical protein